ncbi:MAG: helix-turn-helix domain-containing protein [Rivularia sp. (in: cyanobacteria)]
MPVISKLKDLMDKKGVTQEKLSKETGLAVSTVGRFSRSQVTRIDVATVETLMKYFDLKNMNELFEIKV